MGRLKFDLKPRPVPFTEDEETWAERKAWLDKIFALYHPGETPRPCDCGYFEPTHPVGCDEQRRESFCRQDPTKRLQRHYREQHLKALRDKRVYPGVPFKGAPRGTCWWCGRALPRTKKGAFVQRVFHNGRNGEPDCAHQEDLRTHMPAQRAFLLKRDGIGCKRCGEVVGRWSAWAVLGEERLVDSWWARDGWMRRRFPERPGPLSLISWHTGLQVDHVIPLGLVAHLPDRERRLFFGPHNLQALCKRCHSEKTKTDTREIRRMQAKLERERHAA